jgi:prepilin-type N-terminal cleavage/methylation domain-containing protein/prepilin-type processing-associated H-X9-DG protein
MARQISVRNRGFTLVELLVVISIIGMLVGLLVPAVIMAMERARWILCTNNMRQVSAALLAYENSHHQYPGYQNLLITNNGKPFVDPQTGKKTGVSYIVPLLPLLDRPDIYRSWKSQSAQAGANGGNPASMGNLKVKLDLMWCRSDPPSNPQSPSNSYVVNTGMQDTTGSTTIPRDWPDNGVFFDLYTGDPRLNAAGGKNAGYEMVVMSSAQILRGDGMQNTLLMSENVDAGNWTDTTEAKIGMVWNGTGTVNMNTDPPSLAPPDDNMRINRGIGMSEIEGGAVRAAGNPNDTANSNSPSTTFARPSSYHPGGVNVAYCDGHVEFLHEEIDYYVYCLLMSSNGQRVRTPGTNKLLPNFNVNVNDVWLKR